MGNRLCHTETLHTKDLKIKELEASIKDIAPLLERSAARVFELELQLAKQTQSTQDALNSCTALESRASNRERTMESALRKAHVEGERRAQVAYSAKWDLSLKLERATARIFELEVGDSDRSTTRLPSTVELERKLRRKTEPAWHHHSVNLDESTISTMLPLASFDGHTMTSQICALPPPLACPSPSPSLAEMDRQDCASK